MKTRSYHQICLLIAGLILLSSLFTTIPGASAMPQSAEETIHDVRDKDTVMTPEEWQQINDQIRDYGSEAYLKASNAEADDHFGDSVAISGDTLIVGAPYEDGDGSNELDNRAENSGAAYVFVRDGETWTKQAYLKASNAEAGDFFGHSVAISGDTLVVCAPYEDGDGSSESNNSFVMSGAAYVFIRNGSTWTQQAYLKASNVEADDRFGFSVDISDDTVVIAAHYEDSDGSSQADNSAIFAGAAYVFVRDGETWSQQDYLKASNADDNDMFGTSVSISGNSIVVGAAYEDSDGSSEDDNSLTDSGAAYVFTRSGTTWNQQAYLKASIVESDRFGHSVDISGDTVVIGARFDDSDGSSESNNDVYDSGAVYVFLRIGTDWAQQAYLKASNIDENDRFGNSVSISGNSIVVGVYLEDGNGSSEDDNSMHNSGAAYVFKRSGTTWEQVSYLKASNLNADDLFGVSCDISDTMVLVGAVYEDGNGSSPDDNSEETSGAAYVYLYTANDPEHNSYLPLILK